MRGGKKTNPGRILPVPNNRVAGSLVQRIAVCLADRIANNCRLRMLRSARVWFFVHVWEKCSAFVDVLRRVLGCFINQKIGMRRCTA